MNALKQKVVKLLHAILHPFAGILTDQIQQEQAVRANRQTAQLIRSLQSCGTGVKINGTIYISHPDSCVIGNNVHIDDNAHFATAGGLTIGDNTHLSRNVTISTMNHNYEGTALPYDHQPDLKPVIIGKNAWIGMNVSIVPGIEIGDGAIIGMGTIITHDVPALSIIGSAPERILQERNRELYDQLEQAQQYGGVDGHSLSPAEVRTFTPGGDALGEKLFFVLTTGRSGSMMIANVLSQHPDLTCPHQRRTQLIRLSTQYSHGIVSDEQVESELRGIYSISGGLPDEVYGESDQKFFNIVHILHDLMPESKYIWLIRDGRDVVASGHGRGWYSAEEVERGHPIHSPWIYYRVQGNQTGSVSQQEWATMSVFERNCWYWSYVNTEIERQVSAIPQEKWMQIRLEDFEENIHTIFTFLDAKSFTPHFQRTNAATYPVKRWADWDDSQTASFEKWCAPLMNKYYPDWRNT